MDKRMKLVQDQLNAFGARDWATYRKALLPRVVYEEQATGLRAEGADAALDALQAWTRAFPDLKVTVTNLFQHDDMVMAEMRWEGTHNGTLKGPYGEYPATGKRSAMKSVELFHFEGDKIREVRHYFDMMTILNQIGAHVPTGV